MSQMNDDERKAWADASALFREAEEAGQRARAKFRQEHLAELTARKEEVLAEMQRSDNNVSLLDFLEGVQRERGIEDAALTLEAIQWLREEGRLRRPW